MNFFEEFLQDLANTKLPENQKIITCKCHQRLKIKFGLKQKCPKCGKIYEIAEIDKIFGVDE